jgi:hypothetical protein
LLKKNEEYRKIRKILNIPLGNFKIIQIIDIIRINTLKCIKILVKKKIIFYLIKCTKKELDDVLLL